jgi:lipoate synthase
MDKIQVTSHLSPEIYQQLQEYMTQQGLSEAMAVEAVVSSYFADKPLDELTTRITKVEQDMSALKRHLLAVRFR